MSAAVAAACPFPYDGPPGLQGAVAGALRSVVDPELALGIVDLGLVYGVTLTDDRLRVRLTMTSAACPVADLIAEDVEAALDRVLPRAIAIEVEMVWDPPWTPEMMSERARRFMG